MSQYSLIRHLSWGVLLSHNPDSTGIAIMTEYASYLDVAGHPDDKPYVIAAGFIASERQWIDFESAWRALLKKLGLGRVFHMVDFEADNSRTREEKDAILKQLVTAILAHTRSEVICGVDMDAYRRVNQTYALEQCAGTPYAITARTVSKNVRYWKNKHCRRRDKVLIFVEQGTKHHGDMEEAFRRDRLPVPQKVPKDHPASQAADLLAWEAAFYYRTQVWRESFRRLIGKDKHMDGMYLEQDLIQMCLDCGIPPYRDMPPEMQIMYNNSPKRPRRATIQ